MTFTEQGLKVCHAVGEIGRDSTPVDGVQLGEVYPLSRRCMEPLVGDITAGLCGRTHGLGNLVFGRLAAILYSRCVVFSMYASLTGGRAVDASLVVSVQGVALAQGVKKVKKNNDLHPLLKALKAN